MNDEIKNILNDLDKIAKGEYYPEDLLSYKECKQLLDYITNLQKENKHLSKSYAEAILFNQKRCEQNKELKQRCEKAIEYIKEHTENIDRGRYYEDYVETYEVLKILGGDENDI